MFYIITGTKAQHWDICLITTAMLYLIEESLRKLLEALGAHEALLMVQLTITVDNLLCWGKAAFTTLACGVCQGIGHIAAGVKKRKIIVLTSDN